MFFQNIILATVPTIKRSYLIQQLLSVRTSKKIYLKHYLKSGNGGNDGNQCNLKIFGVRRFRCFRRFRFLDLEVGVDETWTLSYGPLHKTLMDPPCGPPLWTPKNFSTFDFHIPE